MKTIGRNIKTNKLSESAWSVQQMTHTHWDPILERFPIFLRGTSAHNNDYSIVQSDRINLYYRRDEKGLVLAVYSRLNMQLIWLRTYNTFNDPEQSRTMADHLRKFDQRHFVAVVSVDAWEWNVSPDLVRAME